MKRHKTILCRRSAQSTDPTGDYTLACEAVAPDAGPRGSEPSCAGAPAGVPAGADSQDMWTCDTPGCRLKGAAIEVLGLTSYLGAICSECLQPMTKAEV